MGRSGALGAVAAATLAIGASGLAGCGPSTASASGFNADTPTIVSRMNSVWRLADRPGGFVVQDVFPTRAGWLPGGKDSLACATRQLCAMIEQNAQGHVVAVAMGTDDEAVDEGAVDSVVAHIGMLKAVFPNQDQAHLVVADLFQRAGRHRRTVAEPYGDGCVSMSFPRGLGMWTVAFRGPCSGVGRVQPRP